MPDHLKDASQSESESEEAIKFVKHYQDVLLRSTLYMQQSKIPLSAGTVIVYTNGEFLIPLLQRFDPKLRDQFQWIICTEKNFIVSSDILKNCRTVELPPLQSLQARGYKATD